MCVCVFFNHRFCFTFTVFLVLFYFLIVYKFSPPLPRFLIFSISSSRSRLQMIVFLKKAFAPKGGSISFWVCAAPQKKKPNFLPTNCCCGSYSKKSARGEPKRRHLTKTARFVCVSVGVCVISDHFENSNALAFEAIFSLYRSLKNKTIQT